MSTNKTNNESRIDTIAGTLDDAGTGVQHMLDANSKLSNFSNATGTIANAASNKFGSIADSNAANTISNVLSNGTGAAGNAIRNLANSNTA